MQYLLGDCYYKGHNYVNAVEWFKKAAKQRHQEAQFMLGCCYNDGRGIEQDWKNAAYWWEEAADQGHLKAQYNIASYYNSECYHDIDKTKAIKYFKMGADNPNISSPFEYILAGQCRTAYNYLKVRGY